MENYFQAEAFNLDKVLDEFEQNEDGPDSPALSDAKWTQILAPPAHLLSLNPALAHADLSPLESPPPAPLPTPPPLKPRPDALLPSSLDGGGPGGEGGEEERPADVHSPPLPQPNIGKLVGSDDLPPPAAATNLDVRSEEIHAASDLQTAVASSGGGGGASAHRTHFTFEEEACLEACPEAGRPPSEPEGAVDALPALRSAGGKGAGRTPASRDGGGREGGMEEPAPPPREERLTGEGEGEVESPGAGGGEEEKEEEEEGGGTASPGGARTALANGLDAAGEEEEEEGDEEGPSLAPPPSKEDSVTEEKEMEESKQESADGGGGVGSGVGGGGKLNNGRLRPVSVPYGGARPKQPVSLKLQMPRLSPPPPPPSSGAAAQNQPRPPAAPPAGRNKNQSAEEGADLDVALPAATATNGEAAAGEPPPSADPVAAPGSPDNDVQAGQQGALSRRVPETPLGEVAPVWVPDAHAPVCMKCEVKFTFTKRRHHCRACGKVFCAPCCSLKCRLAYMDRKEARVCVTCHSGLTSAHSRENASGGGGGGGSSNQSPNPNNPAEYCSTVPPLQQARASGVLSSPPPTVMVPVGVLKQPGPEGSLPRDQRRVWFADGILPNGDAAESPKSPAAAGPAPSQPLAVAQLPSKPSGSEFSEQVVPAPAPPVGSPVGSSLSLIPEDGLPPILISTGVKGDYAVEERPSEMALMQQLEDGGPDPLVFVLNANLLAMVKLVNYVNRKCWYVTTKGMHAVGQAEVVVLLQCLPDEKTVPKDIFSHFVHLYQEALTGTVLVHLSHSFFTQSFLGSREHGGFLYVSPSFQSLQDLPLPNPPFLFGVLVQKWETPWAKVFPLRLLLRLGAEYRFYPCPLFSVRFRKPLFGETGHTIMNLLADFRNYQYTLPVVKGLVVDMEVRKTFIKIPSNRYNELMKAMNKSNEHVLAMGACFNDHADSHLVCVQNDDGNYHTQAISIHHQPRKVTGACFFVFSGALKASSGYLAKTSIVEDGVMVQITAETMDSLRQSLRDMKDFTIVCGRADQEEGQEHVHVQWTEDDHNFNKGVISPIDGRSMESVTSVKIFHGSEFKANGKVIRWTEVFFLQSDGQPGGLCDPAEHSRLTEGVARAFCLALCPHLKLLKEDGMAKLGLRVTLDQDQVGYLAGSNGKPLPPRYLSDLDGALIPVIHGGACLLSDGPVVMELVFYILEIVS